MLGLGLPSRSPPHHYQEGLSVGSLLGIALRNHLVAGFSPRAKEASQAFKTQFTQGSPTDEDGDVNDADTVKPHLPLTECTTSWEKSGCIQPSV